MEFRRSSSDSGIFYDQVQDTTNQKTGKGMLDLAGVSFLRPQKWVAALRSSRGTTGNMDHHHREDGPPGVADAGGSAGFRNYRSNKRVEPSDPKKGPTTKRPKSKKEEE